MSYLSSAKEVGDFIDSSIWRDMSSELNVWIKSLHEHLEDVEGVYGIEGIKKLQGNIEALRNVKDMPQNILDNILDDTERRNKDA